MLSTWLRGTAGLQALKCYCNSKNCRGYIGGTPEEHEVDKCGLPLRKPAAISHKRLLSAADSLLQKCCQL